MFFLAELKPTSAKRHLEFGVRKPYDVLVINYNWDDSNVHYSLTTRVHHQPLPVTEHCCLRSPVLLLNNFPAWAIWNRVPAKPHDPFVRFPTTCFFGHSIPHSQTLTMLKNPFETGNPNGSSMFVLRCLQFGVKFPNFQRIRWERPGNPHLKGAITMLREPRAHVLSQYKMCRSQWVEEFRQATRQKGQHVSWRHKGACPVVVDHYTLLLTMMEWGAYRTRSYPYSAYQTGVSSLGW